MNFIALLSSYKTIYQFIVILFNIDWMNDTTNTTWKNQMKFIE